MLIIFSCESPLASRFSSFRCVIISQFTELKRIEEVKLVPRSFERRIRSHQTITKDCSGRLRDCATVREAKIEAGVEGRAREEEIDCNSDGSLRR